MSKSTTTSADTTTADNELTEEERATFEQLR